MNSVLFKSMTYDRAMLIVAGFLIAGWMRLAITLTKAADSNEGMMWAGIVCFYAFAPMLAALMGSEFASAGPGGWTWLLARPVARGQVLLTRAVADLITLLLLSLVLELIMGPQPLAVWALTCLLWIGFHGITAWAASLGFRTVAALGVGVLWGLLGVLAGLLGAWAGLGLMNPEALLEIISQAKQGLPDAPPLESFWFLAAAPALGFVGTAALGWWNARARMRIGPRALDLRGVSIRTTGTLVLVGAVAATITATVAGPSGDVPMTCAYRGLAFIEGGVVMHGTDLYGRPEVRRFDASRNLIWRTSPRETCTASDTKNGVTALSCGSTLYVFDQKGSEPRTIKYDGTTLEWWYMTFLGENQFALDADGKRLLYTKNGTRDHYILCLDPTAADCGDGALEPRRLGTGKLGELVFWGKDDVLRFLQDQQTHWTLDSIRTDGTRLPQNEIARNQDRTTSVSHSEQIGDDMLLFTIYTKGQNDMAHVVVWPDGRVWRVPHEEGIPHRCLGTTRDGALVFSAWSKDKERFQIWRVPLNGTFELMGEIEPAGEPFGARIFNIWFSPDGSSAIARMVSHNDGEYLAGLDEGRADRTTHVPPLPSWNYRSMHYTAVKDGVKVTFWKPGEMAPELELIPWPDVPAFLPTLEPTPEPLQAE